MTENTITSEEALAAATEEAMGFAESLGFAMDNPEFAKLQRVRARPAHAPLEQAAQGPQA